MPGANSYIQVAADGSGKKMQTKVSTIGADDVHSEAVFLVDDSGIYLPTLPVSIAANVNVVLPGAVSTNELPDASSSFAPSNATVSAYAASLIIKNAAGVLFAITGYNSSSSDQFIQLHNASSLPADASVPVVTFLVRATRNFSLSFGGKFGRYFSTGIVICNSSTGPTKTIGAADCWFDAQYK